MQCPNCNAQNPYCCSFCGYCGFPLVTSSHPGENGVPTGDDHIIAPDGERRFATVVFADLADFTQISEGLDPEEVTRLINSCLDEMARGIIAYGGQINKYTGDGLMSVFSPSTSSPEDARRAAEAALAIQEGIATLDLGLVIPPLALHVGIARSAILTTKLQNQREGEFTLIGPAVNLASQLEDASAPGQTLVGREVYRLITGDFVLRPVSLPGSERSLTAYELVE